MAAPVTLRQQLLVALVVPAVLTLLAVGGVAEIVARRALDAALGDRLCAIAQAAATLVGPRVLLLEVGDDDTRVKKGSLAKLEALLGVTAAERIVIARIENAGTLLDTKEQLAVGDEYTRARFDRHELSRVAASESVASVLFEGPDGRPYKTGYAPLKDEGGAIVAFIGVEAPASYDQALDRLRHTMLLVSGAGVLLLIGSALFIARRVAVPLSLLSAAAERIGQGQLDTVVPAGGPLEATILADTMRTMSASLKTREEEMQLMLAGIAHEVRNPLGGIELFGGLLKEDLDAADPRRKHVDKILRELGVLSKVVNDFLDFARRKDGEPRPTAVRELLEEVLSLAQKDTDDRKVKIALDAPAALSATIDPDTMKRALLNLVRNAIQAAPADTGLIELAAQDRDGELYLTVADNGPGVPADKREEIFTPFYTTKQKGTGLGLALVKKTVVQHHGQIEVLDREGGGARFVLRIPSQQKKNGADHGERAGHR